MRYAALFFAVTALLASAAGEAQADRFDFRRGFELQFGGAAGGAAVELADPSEGSTSRTFALAAFGRIRHPRTPFGFEQALVLPYGAASILLLDVWRAGSWRAHLDLGSFVPFAGRHLSVRGIDRAWDAVLGFGAEAVVRKKLAMTADARVFLPDPTTILVMYGDFARPVYREAQRGIQLWIGIAWIY